MLDQAIDHDQVERRALCDTVGERTLDHLDTRFGERCTRLHRQIGVRFQSRDAGAQMMKQRGGVAGRCATSARR